MPEQVETKHHANDFITNSFITSPNVGEDLTEQEEALDHCSTVNVSASHDLMCDDHGTARSVEKHTLADLDVQEAHEDGIYRLNERLLSARVHPSTVEQCTRVESKRSFRR